MVRSLFHRPSSDTFRSRPRAIVAGFLFALSVTGPRWGFAATQTLHVNGPATITIVDDAAPTPKASAATPTATLTPSVTLAPVGQSLVVENMALQPGGFYRSFPNLSDLNECFVQTRLGAKPPAGSHVRVTRRVRSNVVWKIGDNTKTTRDHLRYPDQLYPNTYWAMNDVSGGVKLTVEPGDGAVLNIRRDKDTGAVLAPWTVAWFGMPLKLNAWQTIVEDYWFDSAPGSGDGHVTISIDGQQVFDADRWQSDSQSFPGTRSTFGSQMVSSTHSFPAGVFLEAYPPVVDVNPK